MSGPTVAFKLGGKRVFKGRYNPYVSKKRVAGRASALGPELKFFDNAISFNVDSTNEIPATGQLLTIPQDDTQSGRDGRKIVVKSLLFNGSAIFSPGAGATASTNACMYLVQDKQANGAAATVADDNTGIFTASGSNAINAVRCLANSNRFRILKKWAWSMNPGAGATTAYNIVHQHLNCFIKCSIPIEYDASVTTGAVGSIRSNNLFLVAGSQSADDLITVTGTLRVRFVG